MPLADLADRVWYGEHATARIARALLSPASALYGAAIGRINARHDATGTGSGVIPAVSIGNLTVGGTGKTPISAWFAQAFHAAGASPAIVLRGYGDDEIHVHRLLNSQVPVLAGADRIAQVEAAARAGADVVILDDAFQHRRAARVADVVLISADRWTGDVRLLPAGPFREPLASLCRATLVIVTVKAASHERIAACVRAARAATAAEVITVDLQAGPLVRVWPSAKHAVAPARGARVLAVSGIGDPAAFHAQLSSRGLHTTPMVFADHHPFDPSSVQRIVAASAGSSAVVCTLKDAVKLGPRWPSSAVHLWYLSQSVVPRDGTEALDAVIQSVLAARRSGPLPPDLKR